MKNLQLVTDKAAIGFSILCTAHCLAFPLLVVLLPSLTALPLNSEMFHVWMVAAVLPTSVYALTMGCRKHKRFRLLVIGFAGLVVLTAALVVGETILADIIDGEILEKVFTVIGASIIAYAHYTNYQLCQRENRCACPEQGEEAMS